ncbi:MAG TPA: ThuA domain-containing protein [Sphingobacteriaceae bacterium]|jgi:type 1 glutamine amidotransferase|nr:ThuA domain-containing protein [Sphingobacteriaceae bacterium]
MKKTKVSLYLTGIIFFIFILSSCSTGRHAGNSAVNWKKVNVLVYTKNGKGYVHDNIPSAVACIQRLGKQNGFGVVVSDNPADFNDANLKKYNALIFTSTNNDVFDSDEQKVALMRYIQAGGGFVGIHSVTGTERHWQWFKRLVGGTFVRHAKHQPFREIIIDTTNASTSFLPRHWDVNDECYFATDINPDIHVLTLHDLATVTDENKPTTYGTVFPSTWCQEFDGGREWYTALGHDKETYSDPVFERFIMGGIQWVIGENNPLDYSKAHAKSPDDPLPY